MINLLSNAFKFTPSDGKISVVFAQQTDGTAQISVVDTGPSIAEDHLGHLFDRFYQVEGSTTHSHEGTGIGQALVKELIELHEDTIAVESQGGFGTRFTVRLPMLEAGRSRSRNIPPVAPRMAGGSGGKKCRPCPTRCCTTRSPKERRLFRSHRERLPPALARFLVFPYTFVAFKRLLNYTGADAGACPRTITAEPGSEVAVHERRLAI